MTTALSEEQLLDDLERTASAVDGPLTEREYARVGSYGVTTYRRTFGSWNAAKRAAGLETIDTEAITDDELVADLQRVSRSLAGPLTERAYTRRGRYGVTTYRRRFGSWTAAKRRADVLADDAPAPTEEDVLDDLIRVAAAVDSGYVTSAVYEERGRYRLTDLPTSEQFWTTAFSRIGLAISPLYHKFLSDSPTESVPY